MCALINLKKSLKIILRQIIFCYIFDKMSNCCQCGDHSGQTEEIFKNDVYVWMWCIGLLLAEKLLAPWTNFAHFLLYNVCVSERSRCFKVQRTTNKRKCFTTPLYNHADMKNTAAHPFSVCMCVKVNAVLKSSSKRTIKNACFTSEKKHKNLFEN